MFEAGEGVEGDDLTLLVLQNREQGLQYHPVLRSNGGGLLWQSLPLLMGQRLGTAALAQPVQGQISGDGHQPAHGLSVGAVTGGAVPHLEIDILQYILRVVCIF